MVAEANHLLEAHLQRAGLSYAGLAKQLNARGVHLRLRYDHASVARWIRDHAIPRDPVPQLICQILTERLGRPIAVSDIGMARAPGGRSPLAADIDRVGALWRTDHHERAPRTLAVGPEAIAPVWDWANPPADEPVVNGRTLRVDPAQTPRCASCGPDIRRCTGGSAEHPSDR